MEWPKFHEQNDCSNFQDQNDWPKFQEKTTDLNSTKTTAVQNIKHKTTDQIFTNKILAQIPRTHQKNIHDFIHIWMLLFMVQTYSVISNQSAVN